MTTATLYDTLKNDVARVTYRPPKLIRGVMPKVPSEQDFLAAIYQNRSFGRIPVAEIYLAAELSNPHSKAKKEARKVAHQYYKKTLLKEYVAAELADMNGRSVREARADAAWKWREKLSREQEEGRKQRWKIRTTQRKAERKQARKIRKDAKQRERLSHLSLRPEANQFIPKEL